MRIVFFLKFFEIFFKRKNKKFRQKILRKKILPKNLRKKISPKKVQESFIENGVAKINYNDKGTKKVLGRKIFTIETQRK